VAETVREKGEKEAKLTARMQACSEEPKENRSCLIPPGTREKGEDVVAAATNPDLIPSLQMERTMRRTST
jgi:hypothetical protein